MVKKISLDDELPRKKKKKKKKLLTNSGFKLHEGMGARDHLRQDWKTSTTIWLTDAVKNAAQKHWKNLTNEDGVGGVREGAMRKEITVYSGSHSVFNIELAYFIVKRYAPPHSDILDAFAGGPPRGLGVAWVNTKLPDEDKHRYMGFDISSKQLTENEELINRLKLGRYVSYIYDDARKISSYPNTYDFAFTCPPYFDLEVYSDQDNDISNSNNYSDFDDAMNAVAFQHKYVMKPGAFVVIVIGNVRDKKTGELYNLVGDTINNFKDAGFLYWDEAILVKPSGSAAIRASNSWAGKKLVRTHENILIFRQPEEKKSGKNESKRSGKRSKADRARAKKIKRRDGDL